MPSAVAVAVPVRVPNILLQRQVRGNGASARSGKFIGRDSGATAVLFACSAGLASLRRGRVTRLQGKRRPQRIWQEESTSLWTTEKPEGSQVDASGFGGGKRSKQKKARGRGANRGNRTSVQGSTVQGMQTEMSEEEDILTDVLNRHRVYKKRIKGEDMVVFDYREEGEVVGTVRHNLSEPAEPDGVEIERKPKLFGWDDIAGQEEIVLAGSEFDKLAIEAAGCKASASLLKSPAGYRTANCPAVSEAKRVVFAFPEGSLNVTHRLAEQLGCDRCFIVEWPGSCTTAYEVLKKHGKDRLRDVIESARRPAIPETIGWFGGQLEERILDRIWGKVPLEEIEGVSTGWPQIDKYYRPVPGDVTIVTGVPGSGKSEWLLSLAVNMAEKSDWRFLYINFEAKSKDMLVTLTEKKLQRGYKRISPAAFKDVLPWCDNHFAFSRNDFDSPSVDTVLEEAKTEAMSPQGLQGLIIDPYNYIDRCGKFQADMETDFVKSMLSAVKRFANEFKVHVWFVSHPAKNASPAERPSMYNIAGSANWYNKTDNGIVIHRTYTVIDDLPLQTNQTELVIEKIRNKEAGELGEVKMTFDKQNRSFHILDDDDIPDNW